MEKRYSTFGLSKHSESFSNDPKIKDLVVIGQRSYEFLDWQVGTKHSLHFTEFWVQDLVKKVVVIMILMFIGISIFQVFIF